MGGRDLRPYLWDIIANMVYLAVDAGGRGWGPIVFLTISLIFVELFDLIIFSQDVICLIQK